MVERKLKSDKTLVGFSVPAVEAGDEPIYRSIAPELLKSPAASAVVKAGESVDVTRSPIGSPVDVEVIYEHNTKTDSNERWVAVEVWTSNRVYALDAEQICIAVRSLPSHEVDPKHALLGARLVGGQTRTKIGIELSYPFPRPGAEAVFEQKLGGKTRFSHTSSVARVAMRLRVVAIDQERELTPAWAELTGTFRAIDKK